MEIRKAYLGMIRSFQGGWDAMAAALGMSRDALENRIYERKGQSVLVETAMQMQAFSNTKRFAEAIAAASGGTFVMLPDVTQLDNDALLKKFNELHAHLGSLSEKFSAYLADDEINAVERASLDGTAGEIHKALQELLAVAYRIYCRDGNEGGAGGKD